MNRRIAIISEHASPLALLGGVDSGGQNVYVAQIAKHLAGNGDQVDVFTRKDREDLPERINWVNGIQIIHIPAGPARYIAKEDLLQHIPEFTRNMEKFIEENGSYDVIHANFWMSGLVAADLKQSLSIPFVITFHALGRVRRIYQGKNDHFPNERFEIEERIAREADRIIAECPQDASDLVALYNANPEKIITIPGGVDLDEVWAVPKSIARRFLGISPEEKVVLQLGRVVARKGIDNVIRGFARMMREHDIKARLLIVGGESDEPDPTITPELGHLQKVAKEEGVSDKILFVGRKSRQAVKYFYSAADVFVTTPWYEPFGFTPLESMACGTPVIGSEVGGIQYTVAEGITGFLVRPNDPIALSERLFQLLSHEELINRMQSQCVERVQLNFTWEKVTAAFDELFDAVIAESQELVRKQSQQAETVYAGFDAAIHTFKKSRDLLADQVIEVAQIMTDCLLNGHKVLVCGNGGSAADAQHFAAELVGRFKYPDRPALPVISLTTDTSIITAWANDAGYDFVFSRQVEAFGEPGDVLVGISTSGNSCNLIEAFRVGNKKNLTTVALLGGDGGKLQKKSSVALIVPAMDGQRVQETQILLLHLICELVEEKIVSGAPFVATGLNTSSTGINIEENVPIAVSLQKSE